MKGKRGRVRERAKAKAGITRQRKRNSEKAERMLSFLIKEEITERTRQEKTNRGQRGIRIGRREKRDDKTNNGRCESIQARRMN